MNAYHITYKQHFFSKSKVIDNSAQTFGFARCLLDDYKRNYSGIFELKIVEPKTRG